MYLASTYDNVNIPVFKTKTEETKETEKKQRKSSNKLSKNIENNSNVLQSLLFSTNVSHLFLFLDKNLSSAPSKRWCDRKKKKSTARKFFNFLVLRSCRLFHLSNLKTRSFALFEHHVDESNRPVPTIQCKVNTCKP